MTLQPIRRSYPEKPKGSRLRDVDSAGQARKLQALGWALYGGVPLGGALGFLSGHLFLGIILGPVLIYGFVMTLAHSAGKGAGVLYMPSGNSTPKKKEYSRAKALEIRREYEEAIRAYEVAILDAPDVGEPYLRIARLLRDEMKELDLAVHWFRRAQREADLSGGEAIRTHRELAEIFLHTRRDPRRAAPELARLAEAFPDTPDGQWAARELAEIKEEMAKELSERNGKPPSRA